MPHLKDWSPDKQLRILAYGKSGVGKTFGAGTFPRPLVLDFDKGIATLRNPAFVAQHGTPDIIYEQFTEKTTLKSGVVSQPNAFDDATVFIEKMMLPENAGQFDTIILDTATTLSEMALNKALVFMGMQKLSNSQAIAVQHGVVVPKIQDFGAERSLIEQFVAKLRGYPKNLVVLCHEKEISVDGVVTGIVPLLTGKGVEAICLQFDEVYNVQVWKQGPKIMHTILTESDGIRMAKSRYGIPSGIAWNYQAIQDAITKTRITLGATPAPALAAAR